VHHAVLGGDVVLVVGDHGDLHAAGVAVRVPVGVDIDPGVHGGQQHTRGKNDHCPETSGQSPQVASKYGENIPHLASPVGML